MKVYNEILSYLPKDEYVYLTGHVHPDGDCVGATMAMYHLLKASGYKPLVFLEYQQLLYDYLSEFDKVITLEVFNEDPDKYTDTDYSMIVMDSGDLTRIEPFKLLFENGNRTLNIDHHVSNTRFAEVNYVNPKASSTCEMVGGFIGLNNTIERQLKLDKNVAEALYTGLIYDTGVFKHSNTRFDTHLIAAHIVDSGIDYTEITNRLFFTRSRNSLKAMEIALKDLETYKDSNITTTIIDITQMEKHKLTKENTEGIVNMLIEIEHAKVSAFFLEVKPEVYKVSLRSNSSIDVCAIAKKFGGGGHIKAAGCSINGTKEKVYKKVLKELFEAYERNY